MNIRALPEKIISWKWRLCQYFQWSHYRKHLDDKYFVVENFFQAYIATTFHNPRKIAWILKYWSIHLVHLCGRVPFPLIVPIRNLFVKFCEKSDIFLTAITISWVTCSSCWPRQKYMGGKVNATISQTWSDLYDLNIYRNYENEFQDDSLLPVCTDLKQWELTDVDAAHIRVSKH